MLPTTTTPRHPKFTLSGKRQDIRKPMNVHLVEPSFLNVALILLDF